MAVLKSVALPLKNYQNGVYNLGPANVPDWVTFIGVELTRCTSATPNIWPNESTTFAASVEMSVDGGATWQPAGAVTAIGGIYTDKNGVQAGTTDFSAGVITGTGRIIRGTATIAGGPMRTEISIVLRD